MIYIFESLDNNASVILDETTLTEDEKTRGIALKELPHKETKEGKIVILKADKSKEKVWYEYVEDTRVKEKNKKKLLFKL